MADVRSTIGVFAVVAMRTGKALPDQSAGLATGGFSSAADPRMDLMDFVEPHPRVRQHPKNDGYVLTI